MEEIRFGGEITSPVYFRNIGWNFGETKLVEFYSGILIPVTVVETSDPKLKDFLWQIIDGNPISMDLEWCPMPNLSENVLDLFQFASSKGVVLVCLERDIGKDIIAEFLRNNIIFGKGMSNDRKKIYQYLEEKFSFIDIETAYLNPHSITNNFEAMTKQFAGESTADFKDHSVQVSNWSKRPLSVQQCLYAAHDSYAVLLVFNKLKELYGNPPPEAIKVKKQPKKEKQAPTHVEEKHIYEVDLTSLLDVYKDNPINFESPQELNLLDAIVSKYPNYPGTKEDCFLEHSQDSYDSLILFRKVSEKEYIVHSIFVVAQLLLHGLLEYNHKKKKTYCLCCRKSFSSIHGACTHTWVKHAPQVFEPEMDMKMLLVLLLAGMKHINIDINPSIPFEMIRNSDVLETLNEAGEPEFPKKPYVFDESAGYYCKICEQKFLTRQDLINHSWIHHYSIIISASQANSVKADQCQKDNLAAICHNVFHMAELNDNKMTCVYCKKNDLSLQNLFAHIAFLHCSVGFASMEQNDNWPFSLNKLGSEFMDKIVQRYDVKECIRNQWPSFECPSCKGKFDEESFIEHIIKEHCVLVFSEMPK